MIGVVLGKRFERLLFLTAPISLAALVVCLVAIASAKQKEYVEARCYVQTAEVFAADLSTLQEKWRDAEKSKYHMLNYQLALNTAWIHGGLFTSCYDMIKAQIDAASFNDDPAKMVTALREKAEQLRKTPLSAYGVRLPKEANLNLYVTELKIEFVILTRVLQVLLLPVLLLWLGSLYATRYRETLTTAAAGSLAEVFPHLINMYPAFDMPTVRKRSVLAPYAKPIARFVYAWTRVALLLVFIAPPVAAYLYSLFLGAQESFSFLYVVAGGLVSLFSLGNVIAEFFPTHYRKVFPDPARGLEF